jgi:uncharacterized protein (DUF1684 family)
VGWRSSTATWLANDTATLLQATASGTRENRSQLTVQDGTVTYHGAELKLADWRRRVSEMYARVRAQPAPESGHALWRAERDELLVTHPQSPLDPGDPLRGTGVQYWPYQPALRFELPLLPMPETSRYVIPTGGDESTTLRAIGRIEIPDPLNGILTLWWLEQYGGGLFLPLRDATAGSTTYGGGRYLLDSAKGADLGGTHGTLVIDLNFLYHPSCRYSSVWQCPLAPAENTVTFPVEAGERLG